MPFVLLWQLLTQFLLSPWGLIVPTTLLIALAAVIHIQKTPAGLAEYYANQLETCDEKELPQLLEVLVRIGEDGLPGLIKGLSSSREPVFTACRNVLQQEFARWQESDQREYHFRLFSEALLQASDHLSPAAQLEAMRFVDQMMQIRSEAASPESTAHREQTLAHCGQIMEQLASVRQKIDEPQQSDFAPDSIASLHQRTKQPVLLASNGKPFEPASAPSEEETEMLLADAGGYNSLAVPRAERLWAFQQSQSSQPAGVRSSSRFFDQQSSQGLASFAPPSSQTAEIGVMVAQNYAVTVSPPIVSTQPSDKVPTDISEEYRSGKISESGGTFRSDSFLTPELLEIPLDQVPQLPTTQLMRLLHHPKLPYIESAQKTLMGRDNFQETHLKLAWRLYHPLPALRREIVDMLSNTLNIQASVWLEVLLNDPSNEVRYRAASYLATTGDPALQRLLIDRGKRDSDMRIVNLAERLNGVQGMGR